MTDITRGGAPNRKTAAALGLFDGLHAGHMAVIEKMMSLCGEELAPAVSTFKTGTLGTKSGGIIISEEIKEKLLADKGTEYIYAPEFNEVREMPAESFVREILADRLNAAKVVCGCNFHFGKGGSADADELKRLCGKYGIDTVIVPMTTYDGEEISSTRIRKCLLDGEIEKANVMLGREYSFRLPVTSGNRLGRELEFPTINQKIPDGYAPLKRGVYAVKININGTDFNGAMNIGVKPTVSDAGEVVAETHILGLTGDFYGENIETRVRRFIREERKFDSVDELKKQVMRDIENVRGKV